jgi:hypothetical protein
MAKEKKQTESEEKKPTEEEKLDKLIGYGLVAVAVFAVLAAILRIFLPDRVDEKTGMLLALAAGALIIRQASKIELPWLKYESLKKRLDVVEEQGGLPGRPPGAVPEGKKGVAAVAAAKKAKGKSALELAADAKIQQIGPTDDWDSDPNSGEFGGSQTNNDRILEATITPKAGKDGAACTVKFKVRSTDPKNHPLTGEVYFFLHPSFGNWQKYAVDVDKGVAQDEITSWGAFTIGALADDGKTELELDLEDVEGGTEKFYDS